MTDVIGVSWPELTARLDEKRILADWSKTESALVGIESCALLRDITHRADDPACADVVLGALVRLAAVDCGGDLDAVLVLLHLLTPGANVIARTLRDLSPDIDATVMGELTLQIRGFQWRRRTRAFAAHLLWNTRAAVLRELLPETRSKSSTRIMPVQCGSILRGWGSPVLADAEIETTGEDECQELAEVLVLAQRAGMVTATDVELLVELANEGRGGRLRVAARRGVSERTIRRWRDRATANLRMARQLHAGMESSGSRPERSTSTDRPGPAVPAGAGATRMSTFAA